MTMRCYINLVENLYLRENLRVRSEEFGVGEYLGPGSSPDTMTVHFNIGDKEVPIGTVTVLGPHQSPDVHHTSH